MNDKLIKMFSDLSLYEESLKRVFPAKAYKNAITILKNLSEFSLCLSLHVGNEEEKLKFYITSCLFCLCNSPCSLQSLDHVGHVVSESEDLQY